MAAAGSGTPTSVTLESVKELQRESADGVARTRARARGPLPNSIERLLFEEGFGFDFFQAVRILEKLDQERRPVGRDGPPRSEVVRFRSHLSLSFPPSAIYELERPTSDLPVPAMTVTFMGLTGPSGVLPRHYTELLIRQNELKTPEKDALRRWFDQFNHRFISLFYRAWEKYRFYIPYERGEYTRPEPDPFTRCLFSFVGLGTPALRNRMRVSIWESAEARERMLARIDDLAVLHYSGFFAHRPRCAAALEALLQDYFQLPIKVRQFHGQWLQLEPANQSSFSAAGSNNILGMNLVAGERVWDVQSKIRVRLGPLRYNQFTQFLPDRTAVAERKALFLLSHLVRLYIGAELDFDVQLILKAEDVPQCQLDAGDGPRLGWNTWVRSQPMEHDAGDAVFEGEELVFLNADSRPVEWAA